MSRAVSHPVGVVVQFGCTLHVLHSHVFEFTMVRAFCTAPQLPRVRSLRDMRRPCGHRPTHSPFSRVPDPPACFRVVRRPHLSVRMCCHAPLFAQCVGPSMMPTFSPSGDIVVLDRFSPKFVGYELGDVVVARSATNPKQTVCKRILGMVRWEASIGVIDSALDCT